jgi:hypothetical protein
VFFKTAVHNSIVSRTFELLPCRHVVSAHAIQCVTSCSRVKPYICTEVLRLITSAYTLKVSSQEIPCPCRTQTLKPASRHSPIKSIESNQHVIHNFSNLYYITVFPSLSKRIKPSGVRTKVLYILLASSICAICYITLMIEAVRTSEKSVYSNEPKWRYIPKGSYQHKIYLNKLYPYCLLIISSVFRNKIYVQLPGAYNVVTSLMLRSRSQYIRYNLKLHSQSFIFFIL